LEDYARAAGFDTPAEAQASYARYVKNIEGMRRKGLPAHLDRIAQESAASEYYSRLSGEVQARNVQTRRDMSAEERRATPPWQTQDVPDEQQIVRMSADGPQESRKILPQDVLKFLKDAGVPARKFEASTGTEYVQFKDPNVPKGAQPPVINEPPVVRIPKDGHSARPATDAQVANRFDTAPPHKKFWRFSAPTENRGGGSYEDWENLAAALKWRTSRSPDGQFLIRPDQEPRGARYSGAPKPEPDAGPDLSPDQLKLLGSLAPAELIAFLNAVHGDD
jgi:hypothetical protein